MKRRNFITKSLVYTSGAALLPHLSKAQSTEQTKVRLGFIGVGLRGQNHLEMALYREDVEVVAICDIDPHAIQIAQKMIADNQTFIDRFKGTFSKTDAVQSRVKMLEKLVLVQVDEVDTSALKLKFPPAARSGQYPVIAKDLTKSYGDHVVFKDANLVIERGQKVAFVGKNGEGKSTMIKAIMKEIEINGGSVEIGHNAQIGYFAQNQAAQLDENATIFETIDRIAVGDVRTQIKNILGAFMFQGDDIQKKVKVLSGGEKTRLAMIKLLLEPVNVLILDEPTNHLDMKTKDIIKDALRDFDGTLILVSHDRDFLDGLAEKVFEFGHKRVKEHFEDIKGFLAHKKMDSLKEIEK